MTTPWDGIEEPSPEEVQELEYILDTLSGILTELRIVRSKKPLAAHNAAVDIVMWLEHRGIAVSPMEWPPAAPAKPRPRLTLVVNRD